MDYMIFEFYVGNRDWPCSNVRFYAINDGPIRFVLYDLGQAATRIISNSHDMIINHKIKSPFAELFNLLYAQENFKQAYDLRYQEIINSGLITSENFNRIVDRYVDNIEHIMPT